MKQLEHTQGECKIQCKSLLMEASRKKAQLGLGWRKPKFGGGGGYKVHKGQAKGPWGPSSVPPLLRQCSHREGTPGQLEEWEPQRQVSLPAPQPSAESPGGPGVQHEVTGAQVQKGGSQPCGPAKRTFAGIQARARGANRWQLQQRCRHTHLEHNGRN